MDNNNSSIKNAIQQAFLDAQTLLADFCDHSPNMEWIQKMALALAEAFKAGNKILICGNGGSHCDALHFAEEFTGRFRETRPALPVLALSDAAHLTCVGNDFGFEHVFSRGVEAFGKPNDWLILLTTSGNSPNLIEAAKKAAQKDMHTIGLLGKTGGPLKDFCEHNLIISAKTSDRIQEMHMLILHVLIEGIERQLYPELYLS